MSNPFDSVRQALAAAEAQIKAADDYAYSMASLLVGRLRQVNKGRQGERYSHKNQVLRELKRELAKFDSLKNSWKD